MNVYYLKSMTCDVCTHLAQVRISSPRSWGQVRHLCHDCYAGQAGMRVERRLRRGTLQETSLLFEEPSA
jgi:hypothetical protein